MNAGKDDQLFVDENLSDVEKCEAYCSSSRGLHRLLFGKLLFACAKDLDPDVATARLLPLVKPLSTDQEHTVRQVVAENIGGFCDVLIKGADGYNKVRNDVVNIVLNLLVDSNLDVRNAAATSLVAAARHLDMKDRGNFLLRRVLELAHDNDADEKRATALIVYDQYCPLLDEELASAYLVTELAALSDDMVFRVRRVAAEKFANIAKHVPRGLFYERLFPVFLKLSNDSIWGVRRACLRSLVGLAEIVTPDRKKDTLMPVFQRLAGDTSRWVRNASLEIAGKFIHALGSDLVDDDFLKFYTNIPLQGGGEDADVIYQCAHSFPAVALTLGPQRFGSLVDMFEAMVKDLHFQVRRTLAYSLHNLAVILGAELAGQLLLNAFDLFARDVDEVRIGVIQHMSKFLKALLPEARVRHLPLLKEIAADDKWRMRELLASQLSHLYTVFSPDFTGKELARITLTLCSDNVAAVRLQASRHLAALLKRLMQASHEEYIRDVTGELLKYAAHENYKFRQLYLVFCKHFLCQDEMATFAEKFLGKALEMTEDKVPNVRLKLAQVLSLKNIEDEKLDSMRDQINSACEKLKNDSDPDVKYEITKPKTELLDPVVLPDESESNLIAEVLGRRGVKPGSVSLDDIRSMSAEFHAEQKAEEAAQAAQPTKPAAEDPPAVEATGPADDPDLDLDVDIDDDDLEIDFNDDLGSIDTADILAAVSAPISEVQTSTIAEEDLPAGRSRTDTPWTDAPSAADHMDLSTLIAAMAPEPTSASTNEETEPVPDPSIPPVGEDTTEAPETSEPVEEKAPEQKPDQAAEQGEQKQVGTQAAVAPEETAVAAEEPTPSGDQASS